MEDNIEAFQRLQAAGKLLFDLNNLLNHSYREFFLRCGVDDERVAAERNHAGKEIAELLLAIARRKGSAGLQHFFSLLEKKEEKMSIGLIKNSDVCDLFVPGTKPKAINPKNKDTNPKQNEEKPEEPSVEQRAQMIKRRYSETLVGIIGSQSIGDPLFTTDFCHRLGSSLADTKDIQLVIGGIDGVCKEVREPFVEKRQQEVVIVLARNAPERFTIEYKAKTSEERIEIFTSLCNYFFLVQGASGSKVEADAAILKGAVVIPIARTGGEAKALYSEMDRPSSIAKETWRLLQDETNTQRLAEVAVDILRQLLRNLPIEIKARGPDAIRAYNDAITGGVEKPFRSKLMIVGQGRAGKSSVLCSVTGQPFDEQQLTTNLMELCDIDAGTWKLKGDADDYDASDYDHATARHVLNQIRSISIPTVEHSSIPRASPTQTSTTSSSSAEAVLQEERAATKVLTSHQLTPKTISLITKYSAEEADTPFTLNTWDFAGQDIYYSIHPIFISNRAIYLVAFSLQEAVDCIAKNSTDWLHYLDFWINSISHYATESLTMIVGTHSDKVSDSQVWRDISGRIFNHVYKIDDQRCTRAYDEMLLNEKMDLLFFPVDNANAKEDIGVRSLVAAINETITIQKESGFLSKYIPIRWLRLQEEIFNLATNSPLVLYAAIVDKATESNIKENQLEDVLQFFHDIGSIIYYKGVCNSYNEEVVITDSKWLIKCIRKIIRADNPLKLTNNQKYSLKNGFASIEVLKKIWNNEDHSVIIKLLRKFGLLCTTDDKEYVIPFLRKQELPEWNHTNPRNLICYLKFEQFLPESLFHYLAVHFVSSAASSDFKPFISRNGCLALVEEQRLFMQYIPQQRQIKVIVERSEDSVPFSVINALEERITTWNELKTRPIAYNIMVHCPKCSRDGKSNGVTALGTLKFCNGSIQCRLDEKQRKRIQKQWYSKYAEDLQRDDLNLADLKPEEELAQVLSWKLNKNLQHNYRRLCIQVGWHNITSLERSNPGNEIAELVIALYKQTGKKGLSTFLRVLRDEKELVSIELIEQSNVYDLFCKDED